MNILIVDDQQVSRNLLRAVFANEGPVSEAANGVEALEVLARGQIDVVISEIPMPRMDGYRLCYEVRHNERLSTLPFIFYSAAGASADDETLYGELGADCYLRKPAESDALLAVLHQAIENASRYASIRLAWHDETRLIKLNGDRLVHKLEEKNAELATTVDSLRGSEERLKAIIETEPECVKVISPEGLIIEMNPAGLTMFEADSIDQVRGRAILDLVAPEHRATFRKMHARVIAGDAGTLAFETIGLRGTRTWLETYTVPLRKGGKITALLGIARDISKTRIAEAARRVSEARYRRLVESGVIGVLIAGPDGSIIEANDHFLRMLGYTRDEFRCNGLFWNTLTPPEWSSADHSAMEAVRKSGVCPPYDKEYFRKDGSRVSVQLTIAPDEATGEYLCLVTDISQRKRAEADMQRLSGRLLHAQDDEQRRLARELHDSTAQLTAALAINLAVLARTAATRDPAQRELLAECESLAQRVTKELRTVSYLLHPPALDSLGLVRAMEDYARGFAARSGLAIQLELPEDLGRLPDAIELSLFRVVQESLSNAHRHADCKNIVIRLARLEDRVTIEIRDDGCGLPTRDAAVATAGSAGVGIAGMRERLRLLGGRLEIEAAQPGTRVRAILPLSAGGRS